MVVALTQRENYLKTVGFSGPEWIPCYVHLSQATRAEYGEALYDIVQAYPQFFPKRDTDSAAFRDIQFAPGHRKDEEFTDAWGCVWKSSQDGIEGVVIGHPLADWSALTDYEPPDPLAEGDRGPIDWEAIRRYVAHQKQAGRLTSGGLAHGFLLLRLSYLRGFENLVYDLADDDPRLHELIEVIYSHSQAIIDQWLSMDVDVIEMPEDLGTQSSSLISPAMMAKYVTPVYRRLMEPCRRQGKHVAFHSDGYILGIVDQLLDAGVTIINPQDLCNGIDALAEHLKGRVAIRLDIDRQTVIPYGSRQDIHDLIEEEVRKLGSPAGGLEMIAGIYPPTSPDNVRSLCEAFETYHRYFW